MRLTTGSDPRTVLPQIAEIPIAYTVHRTLEVTLTPAGRPLSVRERDTATPWLKDYDTVADGGPSAWPARFDVSRWGWVLAREDDTVLGAATIARNTPGCEMLEERGDLGVLWDLRVAPDARRRGIGQALVTAAEEWALAEGLQEMKIETQNVNAAACRLYARCGYRLAEAHPSAYPDLPGEVQLIWRKLLVPPRSRR